MIIYALINKEIIPYILVEKKVKEEYLIRKTKQPEEKIKKWLDPIDTTLPTIKQAKELAKHLHIPFAALYMNKQDIPIKKIPKLPNYRTFQGKTDIDDSCLNLAISDVLMEREFFLNESENLGLPITPFSITAPPSDEASEWAKVIRQDFSIDLKQQFKCQSPRKFYLYLRERIEAKGIIVQCFSDVLLEVARGFSIYEHTLPVIGLNANDRPPAKSFSLIHELVHLLKRESSLCNDMVTSNSAAKEEVFCNAVAGELLVPQKAIEIKLRTGNYQKPYSLDNIRTMANTFSVSREVIVRRLLNIGIIDQTEYNTYNNAFRQEIEREKAEQKIARQEGNSKGIPRDISRETYDKTSSAVSGLLRYGYGEDFFSKRDIAQHLGIAQKHVDKYLMEVSKWNS